MSLRQVHKTAGWVVPSNRKALALVGVLVLSVFALIFAGREAQAQQQPAATTDDGVAEPVTDSSSVKTSLIIAPPEETSTVKAPPLETTARVETLSLGTFPVEAPPVDGAAPPAPGSPVENALAPPAKPELEVQPEPVSGQRYSEASSDPDLAAPASEHAQELSAGSQPGVVTDLTTEPEPGLEPASPDLEAVAEPILEPGAYYEENEPLWWYADETPGPVVPDSSEEELYLLPGLEDSKSSVVETVGSAPSNAFETLTGGALLQPEGTKDTALANLFSVGEVDHAPVSKPAEDPESSSSSTGPESPLRDTPQPVSPFAPPAGSSFSLSGGSAVGPGGLALLLFCILVSGPILLRRCGKLVLTVCELPKPNSALRLPLERPG